MTQSESDPKYSASSSLSLSLGPRFVQSLLNGCQWVEQAKLAFLHGHFSVLRADFHLHFVEIAVVRELKALAAVLKATN